MGLFDNQFMSPVSMTSPAISTPDFSGIFNQASQDALSSGLLQNNLQPMSLLGGGMTVPSNFDFGSNSGLSNFFGNASMQDYGSLLGGVGGLYKSLLAGKALNDQLKTSDLSRQMALDEQKRRNDFIKTTQSTFGGSNSNYYSA